jgi:hypothetical protein
VHDLLLGDAAQSEPLTELDTDVYAPNGLDIFADVSFPHGKRALRQFPVIERFGSQSVDGITVQSDVTKAQVLAKAMSVSNVNVTVTASPTDDSVDTVHLPAPTTSHAGKEVTVVVTMSVTSTFAVTKVVSPPPRLQLRSATQARRSLPIGPVNGVDAAASATAANRDGEVSFTRRWYELLL